jgi:hypothetical protein
LDPAENREGDSDTMIDEPGQGPPRPRRGRKAAVSIILGLALGIALGAALGNIGMGFALGLFIGLLIGVSLERK